MKKFISIVTALVLALSCLTACSKEEDVSSDYIYKGILTKVKIGMPLSKIVQLQPDGVELYYENDTTVWSINNDTELLEVNNYVPAENPVYYIEDAVITYNFKTVKGSDEIILKGYLAEADCCLPRQDSINYFEKKCNDLQKKHGVEPVKTMVGVEDVDLEVTYKATYNCPSYTLVFSRKDKYMNVEGVDGYYGSYFAIEVNEKEVKEETDIKINTTAAPQEDEEDKKE